MIKQGARLGKAWVQKSHVSQKIVLYFKGVTVNTEDYSQWSHSLHLRDKRHKQFSTPQKEKPTRKKKRKEKARSSVGRSSENSYNTNTKFHFREVKITLEDYKIFLYNLENYNQQSRSPHLKNLQSAKVLLGKKLCVAFSSHSGLIRLLHQFEVDVIKDIAIGP